MRKNVFRKKTQQTASESIVSGLHLHHGCRARRAKHGENTVLSVGVGGQSRHPINGSRVPNSLVKGLSIGYSFLAAHFL